MLIDSELLANKFVFDISTLKSNKTEFSPFLDRYSNLYNYVNVNVNLHELKKLKKMKVKHKIVTNESISCIIRNKLTIHVNLCDPNLDNDTRYRLATHSVPNIFFIHRESITIEELRFFLKNGICPTMTHMGDIGVIVDKSILNESVPRDFNNARIDNFEIVTTEVYVDSTTKTKIWGDYASYTILNDSKVFMVAGFRGRTSGSKNRREVVYHTEVDKWLAYFGYESFFLNKDIRKLHETEV